jgi:hypothetical protein
MRMSGSDGDTDEVFDGASGSEQPAQTRDQTWPTQACETIKTGNHNCHSH